MKELTQIEVWGSGKARREFTYTEDLANWIALNIELIGDFPFVMNTGFGSDYSVDEFLPHSHEGPRLRKPNCYI